MLLVIQLALKFHVQPINEKNNDNLQINEQLLHIKLIPHTQYIFKRDFWII